MFLPISRKQAHITIIQTPIPISTTGEPPSNGHLLPPATCLSLTKVWNVANGWARHHFHFRLDRRHANGPYRRKQRTRGRVATSWWHRHRICRSIVWAHSCRHLCHAWQYRSSPSRSYGHPTSDSRELPSIIRTGWRRQSRSVVPSRGDRTRGDASRTARCHARGTALRASWSVVPGAGRSRSADVAGERLAM
jgi:hypothetical protein